MICKKCKTKNSYNSKYCMNCGQQLTGGKNEEWDAELSDIHEQVPVLIVFKGHVLERSDKKRMHKRLQKIAMLLTTILLLGGILGFLLIDADLGNQNSSVNLSKYDQEHAELELEIINDGEDYSMVEGEIAKLRLYSNAHIVKINGVQTEAEPNENYEWELEIALSDFGENTVEIECIGIDGERLRENVVIYRKRPTLPIEFKDGQVFSTDKNELEIIGTVPIGTKMNIVSSLEFNLSQSPDNDFFGIDIVLPPVPGEYTVTINASSKEYENVTYMFKVKRELNKELYLQSARRVSYSDLVSNLSELTGINKNVFVFTGVVDSIIETPKANIFMLKVDDGSDKLLKVEYGGQKDIVIGSDIKVYVDFAGFEDSIPLFTARYVYINE